MLIGVDVGGTNMRVGVVDGCKVIHEMRASADFSGVCRTQPAARALQLIIDTLSDALETALRRHPDAAAIGIGFPGFVTPVSGVVSQSPNLPGLRDVDLAAPLRQRLGRPVIVENDALAAAYGEYRLSGREGGGAIYLGLGTGVGGGLITGGRPYPGEHGVAMEVGHIIVDPEGRSCGCGNRGCMEQYASASGVAFSYRQATGRQLTAYQISQQAQSGDTLAQAAYALAGEKLAQALAHILKVVDVAHVIIGGGMSAAWPLLEQDFQRRLDADLIPALRGKIRVSVSQAGDQAGILGAALLAAHQVS